MFFIIIRLIVGDYRARNPSLLWTIFPSRLYGQINLILQSISTPASSVEHDGPLLLLLLPLFQNQSLQILLTLGLAHNQLLELGILGLEGLDSLLSGRFSRHDDC